MSLTLRKIEALAPDQSSLNAASKLKGRKKWPLKGWDGSRFIWGECQGSGANPYRTMADLDDLGYKCTCPSRKFPCKHVLSLLWQHVDSPGEFNAGPVPAWVQDWLGRRRKKTSARPKGEKQDPPDKKGAGSILEAQLASAEPALDEATKAAKAEKAAKASERARLARHTAILDGLDDLDRWLLDVLGQGMAAFQTSMHDQCRAVARRLVDAKAPGLAGQIDQLPATLLGLPARDRPTAGLEALASFYLLGQAYRRLDTLSPGLTADVRRLIGVPTKKDDVLQSPDAPRADGVWVCFGARTLVQADELQRVESWFVRTKPKAPDPRFALLVDYHPRTAGRVVSPFSPGDLLAAELAFHPSAHPLRAIVADRREPPSASGSLPAAAATLATATEDYRRRAAAQPWLTQWPISAGPAAIAMGDAGRAVLTDGKVSLPIHDRQRDEAATMAGVRLDHALGLWDGWTLTLLCADTAIGRWDAKEVTG